MKELLKKTEHRRVAVVVAEGVKAMDSRCGVDQVKEGEDD